jgi:hypothetical protein
VAKAATKRGRKPANFNEIGTTGLEVTGGLIREEFLPELRGTKGVKIYKEMADNDPIVGAMLFAISMLIRGSRWTVLPGLDEHGEPIKDTQDADFLESVRTDLSTSWDAVITEILSMLTFGWSLHEIVYKRREGQTKDSRTRSKYSDGQIGWRKLALRSQDSLDRWTIEDDGGASAMHQTKVGGRSVEIPIDRSLLFRTSTYKNNPEGRSALRNAYRPWYFKKKIEENEGIGIERDLAGLPMLTPPEGLDLWNENDPLAVTQKGLAEDLVRSIRRDEQEGVLKPFGWELQLLSSGGSRSFNTSEIISRYDQRIAMTLLADFMVLGHSNKFGSFALSKSKTSMFNTAIGGWLDMIRDVLNIHGVPRLFELNGRPTETLPRFEHGPVETPDLESISTFVTRMTEAGMPFFPNEELTNHFMRIAQFPGTAPPSINVVDQKQKNIELKNEVEREEDDNDGGSEPRDTRDRTTRDRPRQDPGGAANPRGGERRRD